MILENKYLGINELTIEACDDMLQLKRWKFELIRQKDSMKTRLKKERKIYHQLDDGERERHRTVEAANRAQGLLMQLIDLRLAALRMEKEKSFNNSFITVARAYLSDESFQEIRLKAIEESKL